MSRYPVCVDFETFAIEQRPNYPPKPVGVSIKYYGHPAKYYAWGHPTDNNCDRNEALNAIQKAFEYAQDYGILCQNAKFDIDVAETWCHAPRLPWDKIHDTLYLLFLNDHRRTNLSLKPAAAELLGMPPDERDAVADWLIENHRVNGKKITAKSAGAYIAYAPGALVGEYANGDVIRTEKLFELLYKDICDRSMLDAYDRERKLMRVLLDNECAGLPVDIDRLTYDVGFYSGYKAQVEDLIIRKIKAPSGINLNSAAELLAALMGANMVDVGMLSKTATGKYSTAKGSFEHAIKDKTLLSMLTYKAQLSNCLNTFMIPWLSNSKDGNIFTYWNQVRTPKDGANSTIGTRTGRLSSTPNFQNIPRQYAPLFAHEAAGLPECPIKGLPSLPLCRSYIIPHAGNVMIGRDYSQQEPRILAHFEDGPLLAAYQADPWLDMHDQAQVQLASIGLNYARKQVKNTNLGIIYGQGVALLADKTELSTNEARKLKNAILQLYPGLKTLQNDLARRARQNLPFTTWGGRVCYCEVPSFNKKFGKVMEYSYKMPNNLIQGSAGDCTKEAIIRWDNTRQSNWNLLLTVHDEIIIDAPVKELKEANECLREAMESIEFDVKMLSEGYISFTNWHEKQDYDKKGVLIYGN